ncbi:hypothetical protein FO519_005166, partial [Halicephalobus sp. NKZ332]
MIVLLFIFSLTPFIQGQKCAWDTCPKWSDDKDTINLHIIPHSHDDMGWIKTADDYFTGINGDPLVHVSVSEIYNNIVTELKKDSNKRFSICEVGYLTRWMESSDEELVKDFLTLVGNGQIEFVCGGWVQPDEATTHYVDLVDMYTLGLRKLKNIIGENCTKVRTGWQIDPFGHSREHSNILAMLGYESVYFAREHHKEHDLRIKHRNLEFNWYTSDENPDRALITGIFDAGSLYAPPNNLNWDYRKGYTDPIIDNPNLEGYNVDEFTKRLLLYVVYKELEIASNHMMLLMGGDFCFTNANLQFDNIDKLIKIANNITTKKINAFYSTPSCYTSAINKSIPSWTNKTSDFFPYADKDHAYWTGYFTSKPAMKGLVRQSSNIVNSVRQLGVFALFQGLDEYSVKELKLEKALGLSQHHDGITGTSKEFVTQDYERRLLDGWDTAESAFND